MLVRLRDEIQKRREQMGKRYEGIKVHCVLDRSGVLLYISEERKALLGYEPEEFVNRCILDVCHPDDIENVKLAIDRMVSSEESSTTYNFRLQHKSAHWIPMQAYGEPLFENGQCSGFVIVYHERIDQDTLQKKEELEQKIITILNKQKRTG